MKENTTLYQIAEELNKNLDKGNSNAAYKNTITLCEIFVKGKKIINIKNDREDFANMLATDVYMRLVDKTKKPIDNILSYISSSYRRTLLHYLKNEHQQVIDADKTDDPILVRDNIREYFSESIEWEDRGIEEGKNMLYLETLSGKIYKKLDDFKYIKDKNDKDALFSSILLTLIKSKNVIIGLDEELKNMFPIILQKIKESISKEIKELVRYDRYREEDVIEMLSYERRGN